MPHSLITRKQVLISVWFKVRSCILRFFNPFTFTYNKNHHSSKEEPHRQNGHSGKLKTHIPNMATVSHTLVNFFTSHCSSYDLTQQYCKQYGTASTLSSYNIKKNEKLVNWIGFSSQLIGYSDSAGVKLYSLTCPVCRQQNYLVHTEHKESYVLTWSIECDNVTTCLWKC